LQRLAKVRLYGTLVTTVRDGFRARGTLGHLSFWGPMKVWPIWPFAWKTWKFALLMCSAPSKIYLLWFRLWFCVFLRSSTEIEAFPTFFSGTNGNAIFSWNLRLFRV